MTAFGDYGPLGPTSATPRRGGQQLASSLLVGGALLGGVLAGTNSTAPMLLSHVRYIGGWTSNARTVSDGPPTPTATAALTASTSEMLHTTDRARIRWLHQQSGLTWDQLGRAFGVSRRAVHLWVNGGRLNASNAEALARFVAVVRDLSARDPAGRRAALLAPGADGVSIFDEFRARHAGASDEVSGTPWTPGQLLGARHDRPPEQT